MYQAYKCIIDEYIFKNKSDMLIAKKSKQIKTRSGSKYLKNNNIKIKYLVND